MKSRTRHGLWNALIVLTAGLCAVVFAAHWKTWKQFRSEELRLLSGFYYVRIPFDQIREVSWVERVPYMSRRHGFSAGRWEKGLYRDSLKPGFRAHVFVEDWDRRKIEVHWGDSLGLYLNFRDSLETAAFYEKLMAEQADRTPQP